MASFITITVDMVYVALKAHLYLMIQHEFLPSVLALFFVNLLDVIIHDEAYKYA